MTKLDKNHLLHGIELSSTVTSAAGEAASGNTSRRTAGRATRQAPAPSDITESPVVVASSRWTRKQLLGASVVGLAGVGAIAGGFAWAGVERHGNSSLRGTNKLLSDKLNTQTALNTRLQAQVAGLSAQAPATAALPVLPAPVFTAPPPPPVATNAQMHAALDETAAVFPEAFLDKLARDWNLTNPDAGALVRLETENYGNVTYADPDLSLFGSNNLPSAGQIQTNFGIPGLNALNIYPEDKLAVAAAAAAIVSANSPYMASLFRVANQSDASVYEIPVQFHTRDNAYGNDAVVLPVTTQVVTDGVTYVRGTPQLRTIEPPFGDVSDLNPAAAAWFPLLQKQADKLGALSLAEGVGGPYSFVSDAMTALTGNPTNSRSLTRQVDADAQYEVKLSNFDSVQASYVLDAAPSNTFDANIANLVDNQLSRAATFRFRDVTSLPYLPFGNETRAHWDGVAIEPAMAGTALHVTTDDGEVNEVIFSNKDYAFVGGFRNFTTGDLASVMLWDTTGVTIDCDTYDQWMADTTADSDGISDWGVYGINGSSQPVDSQGMPAVWANLPTKSAQFTLPYNVFKKVAVWTDQVNIPQLTLGEPEVDAPAASPFFG